MLSKLKFKKPETLLLLVILVVAAALRFYHYGSFSYSNDELSALNRLHYDTFGELVQKGFYVDGHPGGIQVFLWQWVKFFGDNEWSVRLPFVIMGILAVWMSYKVARYMFGVAAGLFTSAALTFLQFPLLYSQIARPYGPGVLFCPMLIYFWLRILFNENGELNTQKPKLKYLIGFSLSAALCMYNHYFSFLFALIVGFSGFAGTRRNNIFQYIGSALVAAMLFVPHIPITLNHLTFKGVGLWLGVPFKGWIVEHVFFIFDQSLFMLLLFFITLVALLYSYRENKNNLRFRILLAAWFLLPILIGYIYSVKVNPVLQHPVLIFSFPCFIMLIFSYAGNVFDRNKRWILALFLAAGFVGTAGINRYYNKQHFGEFKDIARLTAQWQQQYGNTAITKVININNPMYIDFYLARFQTKARFDLYDINGNEGLKALSEIVRNSQTTYFLYAFTKPTPTEAENIIRSTYPYVVSMHDYSGFSSVCLFSREKGQPYEKAIGLSEIKFIQAGLKADTLIPISVSDTSKAQKLDAIIEYSPGIELNFDEYREKDNLMISAETDLFTKDNSGNAVLVISIETSDGKGILWKGAATKYVEIPGKWCRVINTMKIDTSIPKGAKLKVYFWNKDKKLLYLKNLNCKILE
jgi:uncharacterized membrane protein